uniref:Glutathione synthetase n=1 Tax=Globodera rostochiensis TaxID=31243 RepID=A0A914IEE7_GLORO
MLSNLAICVEFFVLFAAKFLTNANPTEIDHKPETLDVNIEAMVEDAINWAHIHGLVIRTKEISPKNDIAMFMPFALFPTPFPREMFEQARDVQTAMQLLYFRVASDFEFLREHIQSVAASEDRIRRLLEIAQIVHDEGIKQPLTVVVMRSDYMCDVGKNEHTGEPVYGLKQIETNIGQIGGFFNAPYITNLHRRTMANAGLDTSNDFMPINEPDAMVVDALIMAWKAFGDKDAIILMVALKVYQTFQQYKMHYLLEKVSKNKIKIVQIPVHEVAEILTLDNDFSLRFGTQKVAVAFYRSQTGLNNPKYFAGQLMIERSTAIKIPSVTQILSAQKKIQQVLALPGMVERFFPSANEADMVATIRKTFTGLWGLDNPEDEATKSIIKDAIDHPDKYVLKPCREGGGHNFFGEKIPEKLREFSRAELGAHILMQKLTPLVVPNFLVRPLQDVQFENIVSELGIFGFLLGNVHTKSVQHNVQRGHYTRSKPQEAEEGGIYGGDGVVDSPLLF